MGGEDRTTSCLGVKRVLREPEEVGKALVLVVGIGAGEEDAEGGGSGSVAVSSNSGRLAGGGIVLGEELSMTVVGAVVLWDGERCRLGAD